MKYRKILLAYNGSQEGKRALLASGREIDGDVVVLATGSSYPFPAKSESDTTDQAQRRYRTTHEVLAAAERVLAAMPPFLGTNYMQRLKPAATALAFTDGPIPNGCKRAWFPIIFSNSSA